MVKTWFRNQHVSKKGSHFPYVKQGYLHISAEWGECARMMLAAHTSSRKASNYTVHELCTLYRV